MTRSTRLMLMLSVAFAACGTATAGPALAFHPGETHSGAVPQGPDCVACNNQGRQGIDQAISVDGTVHCDPTGGDDGGGDDGGPGPIG